MWRLLLITISLNVVLSQAASGQAHSSTTGSAQQNISLPTLYNLRGVSEDYRIGVGDSLEIQVVDQPKLSQTLKVSNSGDINFPLVGLIEVANLTTADLEAKIASRLQEKKLLQQPEVLVYIREFQAKRIYVTGEVVTPGEFIMTQQLTSMDVILLAGGLSFSADRYGYVHRRTSPEGVDEAPPADATERPEVARPGTEIMRIDLQPLKEGRVLEPDIPLQKGDVLIIPRKPLKLFFVAGEVVRPHNFQLPPERVLLASQAISWAGGPTKTAKMSEGILVRYDEEGKRQELKVDYAAILKGEQKDLEVRANDVIFIPGSKAKTVGQAFVTMTDAMIMQQIFKVGRQMQLPQRPEIQSHHPSVENAN